MHRLLLVAVMGLSSLAMAQDAPFLELLEGREGFAPPAVALLTSGAGDSAGFQCTAFLVDSQAVLTNRHCLPRAWKDTVDDPDCRGRLWFRFAAGGGDSARTVGCSELLGRSRPKDASGQDWALLRLDRPVPRKPLELARRGLDDGAAVQVWSIDPALVERGRAGRFRRIDCRLVTGSPASRHSTGDSLTPQVLLEGCRIESGNSGGPMVDSAGRVLGLVDARFESATAVVQVLLRGLRLLDGSMVSMGQASSLVCADLPGRSGVPAACRSVSGRRIRNWGAAELVEELRILLPPRPGVRIDPVFVDSSYGPLYRELLRRRTGKEIPEILALGLPSCVENAPQLLEGWRNPWYMLWLGYRPWAAEVRPVPVWPVLVGVDSTGRIRLRRQKEVFDIPLQLRWKPRSLAREGRTPLWIDLEDSRGKGPLPVAVGEWKPCPAIRSPRDPD